MHVCDIYLAVANDPLNKTPMYDVTTPEIQLLRQIHGAEAVTSIKIKANKRIEKAGERQRLMAKYPRHSQLVVDMWRDNGGQLPTDVQTLGLSAAYFRVEQAEVDEQARVVERLAVDELEDEEEAVPEPSDV